MKKAIIFLSAASIVLYVLFFVLLIGAGASASSACGASATSAEIASSGCANSAVAGFGISFLFFLLGVILAFVAWILGLIKTAQAQAWGWFVVVLLLSPLGSLIYGIAGPDQKKVAVPAGAYLPNQPR